MPDPSVKTWCLNHQNLVVKLGYSFLCRFDQDRAHMTTYIATSTSIYHMEIDLYTPGNVLFSEQSALETASSKKTSVVAGSVRSYEYAEGVGGEAKFNHIKGFHQTSRGIVVVADHFNNCLRVVNRRTGQTQPFSGTCTKSGSGDGTQKKARFNGPWGIIPDNQNVDMLLVTDWTNKAVRHVNINTGSVSTLLRDGRLDYLNGITQEVLSGNLFLTTRTAVYQLRYNDKMLTLLDGDPTSTGHRDGGFSVSRFDIPREILLTDFGKKIVVADSWSQRLRVLDRESNMTYSICDGSKVQSDGNTKSCSLFHPRSLMVSGDYLYCGVTGKITRFSGILLLVNIRLCDCFYCFIEDILVNYYQGKFQLQYTGAPKFRRGTAFNENHKMPIIPDCRQSKNNSQTSNNT